MEQVLNYKNYVGSINEDLENKKLYGKVLFIGDSILYEGRDIEKLEKDFQEAIDLYLDFCETKRVLPDKTIRV